MRFRIILLALSIATAAWGEIPKQQRLTWAPYSHLELGFRTIPWAKDPFYPELNGFKLSGIISNELAYINGRWLREGDEVEGYLVKEILQDQVTLGKRSEILILKMEY